MSNLFYPAIFHPEDTGYSVYVPDIDGCFTQGDTLEEAYDMAFDAVGLCLEDLSENGLPYPAPSKPEDIKPELGDCVVLIKFDLVAYSRKHDTKAVKKTLTIPSWLDILAKESHINFSQVLQSALMEQLGVADTQS